LQLLLLLHALLVLLTDHLQGVLQARQPPAARLLRQMQQPIPLHALWRP
jgi:hypothetical protein